MYTGKLSFDPSLLNLKGLSLKGKDGGNSSQCINRIVMAQRKHLDDFLRGRIIGRQECGRIQLEVSEELGIAQSVISRRWQRFQDDGNEDITCMDWPAYSPDLNTIEHVWDMLGQRIAARQPPLTCLLELRRALPDEWCNIPQDQIDNLILSIPRRCKACIASSGRRTPY
ncbi:uncharacterized protein TNCV_407281 [Trichonephila clavipes]|nr:uncharacterized protein TNCV_407281 [Trichonephila clavipes]